MDRLVILGGSSPFTLALVDQICEQNLPPFELVLHGRDETGLALVADYARMRLAPGGWDILAHTDSRRSLEGARIVLHQIRYGDLSGRAADEEVALRFRIPPDETLGPAALRRMLALRSPLARISEQIARHCPDAWVLNLTNPLSLVTAMMAEAGIDLCIGLCELPKITAEQAAEQAGLPAKEARWRYAGLNHRGFVVTLEHNGRDGIAILASQRSSRSFNGFAASLIGELQAVPTKYFHLILGDAPASAGRADFLNDLRRDIFNELRQQPSRSPPSLTRRYLAWYELIVVPVLRSLTRQEGGEHVVNVVERGGLAREVHARITPDCIEPHAAPTLPPAVARWIMRFEAHELALLDLARSPSSSRLRRALELDPLVPPAAINAVADALLHDVMGR